MGIMQDLWQTSRAGGGEGWFGMQPKMSGIQKSEMGGFGEEPTHKYIDPETSGMQIRGILGALSKINLRRDLQEESEAGYWKGGEYGAVNYGDTEKELPNYYQRGGGDTDDVIDAYSKYYKSPIYKHHPQIVHPREHDPNIKQKWPEHKIIPFNWNKLKDKGVLIFKYCDLNIKVSEMLKLFHTKPLFGTITKKGVNNTYFFCFMKVK